jgi:hypothetical protein
MLIGTTRMNLFEPHDLQGDGSNSSTQPGRKLSSHKPKSGEKARTSETP